MTLTSSFKNYDIIGDIHGCSGALERLLQKLGYQETPQGYRYLDTSEPRQAIFVGDLIDRGYEIRRIGHAVLDGSCGGLFQAAGHHAGREAGLCSEDGDRDAGSAVSGRALRQASDRRQRGRGRVQQAQR